MTNVQEIAAEHYLKIVRGELPRTINYEYTKTLNYIVSKLRIRRYYTPEQIQKEFAETGGV